MQSKRIQSSSLCPEILLNGSTWVDLLRQRTLHQPNQLAFTFLPDGETEGDRLTYGELDRQARAIASQLQALGLSGECALLLYPPGLEYLAAFFGCLYAGVVAVPAYPPRNQRNMPRIQAVVANAQAAIALTTTATLSKVQSLLAEKTALGDLQWLTTDSLGNGLEERWQEPSITTDTLAFLQYTSGSTGTPKGVMLSHGNLLHNAAMTYRLMEHSPQSKFVSWLPTYHDMGLIGGILQPLYGGFPCILMPPAAFLQRPYRWLQAISRYQGTTSGGPNFAYELCLQRITPEQLETLDLSCWDVAFNGAEPIRQETLEKFCTKFAPCGFRPEAFYPCYGMAEASLMVSGGRKTAPPVFKTIQGDALERNQAIEASTEHQNKTIYALVGCGQTLPDQTIRIVHPETFTQCLPNEIGEIWVSGASIGYGYWHQREETEKTFRAYLSDTGQGPFLRTGDLGFLQNGELFITGRLKDLIIIRGRNLYPQDIERTVERSHPSLRTGSGAAFTVEVDNEERLVVVQELEFRAKPNIEEVTAAIRQAVTEDHEVQVYGVVLIKPGSIPKTSSGKIQRRACKAKFLAGNLIVIERSILNVAGFVETIPSLNRDALLSLPPGEGQLLLESYLQKLVAQVMQIIPSKINLQHSLSSLGLDSLRVFELKNRIEVDLEVTVSIGDFFEGSSITQWAIKILEQLKSADCIPSLPLEKATTATNIHPLSFAQQRLWVIDQLEPGNPAYNISFAIRLEGSLKVTLLERSLNEIVRRHEILRTTFSIVNGQPVQIIAPSLRVILSVVDYQELPELERESEAQRVATQESQQPFDLTHGPLLRAKLVRLGQQKYRLLLTMHHIILDGLSAEVFIQEMVTLYKAFLTESSLPLPELSIQYKDFVYWQRQWLQGEQLETQLNYWKQQLEGVPAVLQLPTDHPRPAVQTFRGASQSLELPQTLTDKLKALSRQEGVTLFMVLLATFQTFLYRYTGQNDIPVGSPIANRNHSELKELIGFFVNTLVLRTNLGGNPSFRELLGRVRQVALGAYTHHDLPFEQLVETLRPQRDVSYNPLFQVSFTLQNAPQLEEIPGLTLNQLKVESLTSQFDLSLFVEIKPGELTASFEYNTDLFENATITRMLGHFSNLLEGIVANPDQRLSDLPLLSKAEQHQQLVVWNDTQTEYPKDFCIHQLFEAQVKRTPDATAVVFENQQLTYRELNNRANQLAHYLQKLGMAPEVLVGICVERSLEMVIGLLGILKAGGAYVPLDPTYPQERLAFMLEDACLSVLLTQTKFANVLPQHNAKVVCLDADGQVLAHQSQDNPSSGITLENLAYLIYTSGSTGQPKGAMNTHQGLCNRLLWMQDTYPLTATDRVLQKTPFSFDVSVWEFFWPLIVGAHLVLAKPEGHRDSTYLVELIAKEQITTLHFVPSMLQLFLEEPSLNACSSIKRVICSGETLSVDLQERFFARLNAELHNLYGPTEAAIDVTFWVCQPGSKERIVPIGRPIANTQIYLLDQHLQPVPVGVPGELHIGGIGLARGYLNRPELTAEKFIPNPFEHSKFNRLYKTGDLARYLPDGTIEFLGRIDNQVKIRGFRIELGEVEAVLVKHPRVREVVVLAQEEDSDAMQLVAYVVSNSADTPTTDELRSYLKEWLPDYMVPSIFVLLEALPLLPNGKVDRHALPASEGLRPMLTATYEAPRSEVERAIATIWRDVLHLEKVGINDNFFDLGGHSLLIIQVHSQLRERFNWNLSIIEMFQNPTIKTLVQYLSQKQKQQPFFGAMRDRVQKQLEVSQRRKPFHR
ncbi:MAG: amino acid adenylation domain-containing protein [Coleofasciculus sp. B1-GNL1-01]|uniref:amino acid adenylation domain-containing protein n=1 Tax=Coleofasciculus sp. B1-GNL1-01 TaxID=3068484 RepID=UPI0032FBD027